MYTYRRLRHVTRWRRRAAFALVFLLLVAASWRAWQRLHLPAAEPLGQQA